MKLPRHWLACLFGVAVAFGLMLVLRIPLDARRLDDRHHDLAYRLYPVLGSGLVIAAIAYLVQSRTVFAIAITCTLCSLLVPEPSGRWRYSDLESAMVGAFRRTFAHSLMWSLLLGGLGLIVSIAAHRLMRAIRTPNIPSGATQKPAATSTHIERASKAAGSNPGRDDAARADSDTNPDP